MSAGAGARDRAAALSCPSASPDWEDAQLLGVVAGTARVPDTLFVGPRPVDAALLALAAPATPAEIFRFTARCREGGCANFEGGRCRVAASVVRHLAPVAEASLPRCGIRTHCRWWHEQGAEACRRCPTVVTDDRARDGAYAEALRRPAEQPRP